jgi:hypothetical protein
MTTTESYAADAVRIPPSTSGRRVSGRACIVQRRWARPFRALDERLGLCAQLSPLLVDRRDPERVQHGRLEHLRQRVFQIAMGYEDQNDATSLRHDPAWKVVCGRDADEVDALSSQPSLSRFEHAMTARSVVQRHTAWRTSTSGRSRRKPPRSCWTSTPRTTRRTVSSR